MTTAVVASALRKSFGTTVALDGLDLAVSTGEVHGFLGPNGSGKSVTIRVLLGLLRSDAGEVSLLGGDPWRDAVDLHRRIAYVPGDVSLWPNLSGGEVIDLLARLRGGIDKARRDDLIERLDLDPTKKARTYSKGNRQKVALVAALASDAELLLLDEPTAGLDPLMEVVFQECILEVKRQGRTVLLSSHILAEVEKLCDRLTIIRKGRTVEAGSLAELRHMTRTTVESVTQAAPVGLEAIAGIRGLTTSSGGEAGGTDGGTRVGFEVEGAELGHAIAVLSAAGIETLSCEPPTLEELFLRHYGEELEAAELSSNDSGTERADD